VNFSFTLPCFLVLGTIAALQTSEPVSVQQEPHHKVLLKNEDVLVLRCTLPAGETTLYHTHSYDGIAVELAQAVVAQQQWNKPETSPNEVHPGEITVRVLKDGPYTHRIRNVGKETFDVMDVEVLRHPEQPSTAVAGPVAAETPEARAYQWNLAPGEATPLHTHERPYIILAVTAFPLRMTSPDGQTMSHELKPGDFHWVTSKVTHTLANEGKEPAQIVEIELK
jgi:quercetin dioxygenase-like cupin family protein